MPWVKLDDSFPDHPKLAVLGADRIGAIGLYVFALCYANRYLTDGTIPAAVLPPRSGRLAGRLVEAGLWEELPGGWRIHDFHDYQPTRSSVLARRAADRERAAHARRVREESAGNPPGVRPDSGGSPPGVRSTRPVPGPYPYPVESSKDSTPSPGSARNPAGRTPDERVAAELAAEHRRQAPGFRKGEG